MEWEVYQEIRERVRFEYNGGSFALLKEEDVGSGIRVYEDGRILFFVSPEKVDDPFRVIKRIRLEGGKPVPADPIPPAEEVKGEVKEFRPDKGKEKLLSLISVLNSYPDIKVDRISLKVERSAVKIFNSKGLIAEGEKGGVVLTGGIICERKGDRTYFWDSLFYDTPEEIDEENVGNKFVKSARVLVPASPLKSGKYSGILDPMVVTEFMEMLVPHFSSSMCYYRESYFYEREKSMVFSKSVSFVDNPEDVAPWFSLPFDGEGIRRKEKTLVEHGRFVDYMYNGMFSRVFGKEPCGHSVRERFASEATLAGSSVILRIKNVPYTSLVERLDDGVIIVRIIGGHTVDKITGEFSVGAEGVFVKSGNIERAFRGVTFSGNIFSLFERAVCGGDDVKVYGRFASPSVLVDELVIGG